jgi:hypothetical protein
MSFTLVISTQAQASVQTVEQPEIQINPDSE